MLKKSARYQRYSLDIFAPSTDTGRWKLHVWPPSRKAPIILPAQASEEDAISVGMAIVDYLVRGSHQQTA
jgi:hypothetical protein